MVDFSSVDPQCGARLGVGALIVLFTCDLVCLVNSFNFKRYCLLCSRRKKNVHFVQFFFTLIRGKLALLLWCFSLQKLPDSGGLSLLSFFLFLSFLCLPPSLLLSFLSFSPSLFLCSLPSFFQSFLSSEGTSSSLLGSKHSILLPFRLNHSTLILKFTYLKIGGLGLLKKSICNILIFLFKK